MQTQKITISKLSSKIVGGATPTRGDEKLYTTGGIKLLRILNILPYDIDLDDVKYIADYVHNGLLNRSRLQVGDILMTITGRVGTCAIVREDILPANINQHIVILRINNDLCLTDYFVAYMNSQIGTTLSNQPITGGTRMALDYKAIGDLIIPIPPLDIQRALVADLDQARATRKSKLAEAEDLLKGMDEVVMRELGLQLPPHTDSPLAFSVRLGDVLNNNRLNADYFHPERTTIVDAIKKQFQDSSKPLGEIVNFIRDTINLSSSDSYIGLASVQSHTGERILMDEMAEGQAFQFQMGDVLYGRLRPYLNKVYHAESEGLCSTEFHVMQVIDRNIIKSEYLATLLRTNLILNQTKHMMSGNTHPRLTNDDVVNLIIPIPPTDTQQRIVDELHARRDRARQLRQEADAIWHEAQGRFEHALLGE